MPRKNAPEGSSELRNAIFRIADALSNSKRGLAKALGVSYYRASKIVNAKRERQPVTQWIGIKGEKRSEKRQAELQKAVEKSGWEIRETRERGKKAFRAIPPETRGRAQKVKSKKQYGDIERKLYDYDPNRKVVIPPGGRVQIIAKGKGKSKGKNIKKLAGSVAGDWTAAWSLFLTEKSRTGFTASQIQVITYSG